MYSLEHKLYLRKIRKNNFLVKFFQIFLLIFIILLWQFLADKELINTFITSSPKEIIETLINLHKTNNLYQHIWTTIYETLISFALGTLLGCVIASILWWNKFIAKIVDPFLTVLNSLPKVALGPIIIIWFGAGIKSIIIMSLLISLIITIINVADGFNKTDANKIKLLKSFKATKSQIFFKLILPHNYKTIISALKINISMSLIGVIMGEFLVSKKGIGYLIIYGSQVFNLSLVMTGVVLLAIVSIIMYYSVSYIEKRLTN
ncbi:MAG: ABC transporter permease [Lactobacillales bacterium]|nr:ABC transporter permease [Lactobacillales bacterium]